MTFNIKALYDYDYSPIDNYDRYEVETIDDDGTTTYGRRDANPVPMLFSMDIQLLTPEQRQKRIPVPMHYNMGINCNTGTTTKPQIPEQIPQQNPVLSMKRKKAGFNSPNTYTNDKNTETYNTVVMPRIWKNGNPNR